MRTRIVTHPDGTVELQVADLGYRPVKPTVRTATTKEIAAHKSRNNRKARRARAAQQRG